MNSKTTFRARISAWSLATAALLLVVAGTPRIGLGQEESVRVGGTWSGYRINDSIAKKFQEATGGRAWFSGCENRAGFDLLAARKLDILVYTPQGGTVDDGLLAKAFPRSEDRPQAFCFGYFVLRIVTNRSNPIKEIDLSTLQDLLAGKVSNWRQIGGYDAKVVLMSEGRDSKSREMLQTVIMRGKTMTAGMGVAKNQAAVISAVAKDPGAVGFVLHQRDDLTGVNILAIRREGNPQSASPVESDIYAGRYPLTEPLVLWVPITPSESAWSYCRYALGAEIAKASSDWSIFPERDRQQFLSARRLADLSAGKGTSIASVGSISGTLIADLGREFVRTKALAQVQHRGMPELGAVEAFLRGADMLWLEAPPSAATLGVLADQWNQLSPKEFVVGGKAVAILTNAANPVESLTLNQVRSIFSGEIDNWKRLGGADAKIACHALPATDPAAALFGKELLSPQNWKLTATHKTSAAVLAAVAGDANAIAMVDAVSLGDLSDSASQPATRQAVRVLDLKVGRPGAERIVRLTRQTVADSRYPLSQRLILYVKPKASDLAQEFVDFVASRGRSAVSPFFSVSDEFRAALGKHGLLSPPDRNESLGVGPGLGAPAPSSSPAN